MPSTAPTDLMTLQASSLSYFQQTAEVAKVSADACSSDSRSSRFAMVRRASLSRL